MAAKQRGGGSKKRLPQRQPSLETRFHAQPPSLGGPVNGNAPLPLTTPEATQSDNYMQTRREFIFASLVGHRITVTTRDGSLISGVFALHGNSQLLPSAWRSQPPDPHEASPTPESTFVLAPRQSAPPPEPEDDGWRVVKQKRRTTVRTKADAVEDTNSSVSSNSEPPPAFELLYAEHRATRSKQSYLWLRCAYRVASTTQRSSRVMEWLALPWDDVSYVSAVDVPDNPDELGSSRPRLGFQTDAEISQNTRVHPERQLQRWAEEGADNAGDTSWPATIAEGIEEGPGSWDQFTVNEHKFGVKSTYVDGMYSTALNEEVIPQEYIKRADQLAEEMDAQRKNRVREGGRFQYRSDESGDETEDEEARFSAVAGTGRYANPKVLVRAARGPSQTSAPENQSLYNRRSLGRGRHEQHHPLPPPSRPSTSQQRPDLLKRQSSSHASNTSAQHSALPPPDHSKPKSPAPQQQQNPPAPTPPQADSRNVKDNINALNLEPIRQRNLSQRKEGAWVLPTTASSSSQQASDLQEKRMAKKAEFLKSLRLIETNLAKKGWDSVKHPANGENSSYRTADTTATPPSTRKQVPGERPSSAAVTDHHRPVPQTASAQPQTQAHNHTHLHGPTAVASAQHHNDQIPAGSHWQAPPMAHTGSGTGDGLISEDVSSTAEESLLEKRLFQFNPNATTFTPKGNGTEAERVAPTAPAAPEAPKPPLPDPPIRSAQSSTNVPAVKRSNVAFKPFDPVLADLRRRGKHSGEETANVDDATEMSMVSHFYDIFVETAREGVVNQPPSQQSPDWDNKLAISYTDLLQPTSMMTAMPTPQTAGPAFFAPSAPQTPQAIFFPSATGATLNPAAPPFTHVTPPHFFNVPIMRPAVLTQGMAEPPPGALQPTAAYHPILLPHQRWPPMASQPEGQPWQVVQAGPAAAYASDLFATYGLVCQRMPYQMPR